MIPARKFQPGEQLVWLLIRSSLRKHFDRIFFRTRTTSPLEEQRLPMLMCANHSSWWDGYIAALVEHHLHLDGYLMMEEAQLRRYFFFSWIGCFSVDRHNTRSALQSLQYAAGLLKAHPRRMLWLFPQGEIFPNDRRPLNFYNGTTYLARMTAPVLLYPVATRIEYLAEQRPDLYISLGEPLTITAEQTRERSFLKNCTHQLEKHVTAELDQLREDVINNHLEDFTLLMQGRASTNRIFDAVLLRKQMRRQ